MSTSACDRRSRWSTASFGRVEVVLCQPLHLPLQASDLCNQSPDHLEDRRKRHGESRGHVRSRARVEALRRAARSAQAERLQHALRVVDHHRARVHGHIARALHRQVSLRLLGAVCDRRQQRHVASTQAREQLRVGAIGLPVALGDQLHASRIGHHRLRAATRGQARHPRRVTARLENQTTASPRMNSSSSAARSVATLPDSSFTPSPRRTWKCDTRSDRSSPTVVGSWTLVSALDGECEVLCFRVGLLVVRDGFNSPSHTTEARSDLAWRPAFSSHPAQYKSP